MEQFSRNIRLLGQACQDRLASARVAVFGLGGVGSYLCEALCRAGIGQLMLVDGDVVEPSNLNRQLIATWDTLGQPKVLAARQRVASINPACKVDARQVFISAQNAREFDFTGFDYVCDAIDTVKSKIALIQQAHACSVAVISCMGAGNKLDPTAFRVDDIEKTSVCPLARVMRRELRARGISVRAVYSTEPPRPTQDGERAPGSVSFVPAAAGLVMAGEVIRHLAGLDSVAKMR